MVSLPILPLPKPQRSSRFPVNCNRTARKKNQLAKRGERSAKQAEWAKGANTWAPLLSSAAPPGSGLFCRKTGPNLTPFRGSGRLFRLSAVVRAISRDITPGQKIPYRRHSALRPTKPPRTSPARSRRPATSPKYQDGGWEHRTSKRIERQPKASGPSAKPNPTHVVGNVKTL